MWNRQYLKGVDPQTRAPPNSSSSTKCLKHGEESGTKQISRDVLSEILCFVPRAGEIERSLAFAGDSVDIVGPAKSCRPRYNACRRRHKISTPPGDVTFWLQEMSTGVLSYGGVCMAPYMSPYVLGDLRVA